MAQIKYHRVFQSFLIISVVVLPIFLLPWAEVDVVSGVVVDTSGMAVSDAVVRVKGTDISTVSDSSGRFSITGFGNNGRVRLTAWREGYYISGVLATARDTFVELQLIPYCEKDHPEYGWMSPEAKGRSAFSEFLIRTGLTLAAGVSFNSFFLPLADHLTTGCKDCHDGFLYDQWASSAHAAGFDNPLFATMYNGTDVEGNKSMKTQKAPHPDYGEVSVRPKVDESFFGPGYKLDFPYTKGNCASCHLPGAAANQPYGIDPNNVKGTNSRGIHCDFCHKMKGVRLDPATGIPYENRPGVLSIELRRPDNQRQLFFGPYDDVDVGPDTYNPLMKQSKMCAPCHSASFWDVPVYESFPEWLGSPYATSGTTCQDCHMKPDGITTNFAAHRGGINRDPATLPTHFFPGASDEDLLRNAITMDVKCRQNPDEITVKVSILNDKTGHHVPTGSPMRHLILHVQATDINGRQLSLCGGPVLPSWCGEGDPDRGFYAGFPGKVYAKVLEDLWTGISPTASYWNPARIIEDSRIPAFGSDSSTYTFDRPYDGAITVDVKLLYRRTFIQLQGQKKWDLKDILMAHEQKIIDYKMYGDEYR